MTAQLSRSVNVTGIAKLDRQITGWGWSLGRSFIDGVIGCVRAVPGLVLLQAGGAKIPVCAAGGEDTCTLVPG